MSDTESTTSQVDSFYSPLRFDSPLRSDEPYFQPENNKSSKSLPAAGGGGKGWRPWPHSEKPNSDNRDLSGKGTSPVVLGLNRMVREEPPPPRVKKVGPVGGGGVDRSLEEGYGGGRVDEVRLRSSEKRTVEVRKVALVFRVFEVMACLVSFSVMAADKTQGWSGDSFDRYKEYRYCLAVNITGFVYSALQAFDLAYNLGTEKHIISHHLRYHFGFSMDQATTRVDDWISNWGKDEFTLMATASIAMSFLAFVAFALSSLVSGYNLCNRDTS
ncbi:hypothetical protein RD792_014829 [Penstemon davidsonii]|uniref:CASP-like protein n=1 Tax=Penstemon davidsonii TaxID=160366 RepID=A0ABR0CSR3_9LAMI|nr:hypothetical protein RD792_014829 [Penstemon davidsonii]